MRKRDIEFRQIKPSVVHYNLLNLRQLIFEVTDACNLTCTYCAYSDLYTGRDSRIGKRMDFNQAKTIIDYLSNIWRTYNSPTFPMRLYVGFYGGEPLLNFDLIKEIIVYLEKQDRIGKTMFYTMTTNGLLLDKYIDFLIEKDFTLLISLDGDEYAQGFRIDKQGNNSFERVYKNVKHIQKSQPRFFEKRVNFSTVLHSRNNIDSIYDFFYQHFSKTPIISQLNEVGVNKEKENSFRSISNNYLESFQKANNRQIIENKNFMLSPELRSFYYNFEQHSDNIFDDYFALLLNKEKVGIIPTGTCTPFSKKMFVSVNGKIIQCERIGHECTLGVINSDKVEFNFDSITNAYNKHVSVYITQCESCTFDTFCTKCIYQSDDFHKGNHRCSEYIHRKENPELNLKPLRDHPSLLTKIINELKVVK